MPGKNQSIVRAGICTPVCKTFRLYTNVGWLKKLRIRGVVIGRRILFADRARSIPVWLFRHELEHAYQQIREGRVRFYVKYFFYAARYGYKNNPFEVEAKSRAYEVLTNDEETIRWTLKDV